MRNKLKAFHKLHNVLLHHFECLCVQGERMLRVRLREGSFEVKQLQCYAWCFRQFPGLCGGDFWDRLDVVWVMGREGISDNIG